MEEQLIVGLGNPESDYAETRHNLGVECVQALAARWQVPIKKKRWDSLVVHAEDHGAWLLLPQTFMNESGRAVARALRDTGVEPSAISRGFGSESESRPAGERPPGAITCLAGSAAPRRASSIRWLAEWRMRSSLRWPQVSSARWKSTTAPARSAARTRDDLAVAIGDRGLA